MTDLKALDALEDEMEDFEDAHPDGEGAFSANEFHAYAETCQEWLEARERLLTKRTGAPRYSSDIADRPSYFRRIKSFVATYDDSSKTNQETIQAFYHIDTHRSARFESRAHRLERFTELFTVASYQAKALEIYKDEDAIKELYVLHFGVFDEKAGVRRMPNEEELAEQLMTHVIKVVTPSKYKIATEETGVKRKSPVMRNLSQEIDAFAEVKSPNKRKRRPNVSDDSFSSPLSFDFPPSSPTSSCLQRQADDLAKVGVRPFKRATISPPAIGSHFALADLNDTL